MRGDLLTWPQLAALRALIKGDSPETIRSDCIKKLRQLSFVRQTPNGITVTEQGIRAAASLSPR
jgi:hypothetical protein